MSKYKIKAVTAWQVWVTSELMTVEVEVRLRYNAIGRGTAPVSITSIYNNQKFQNNGLYKDISDSIRYVCEEINSILKGILSNQQDEVDRLLTSLTCMELKNICIRSIVMATSIAKPSAITNINYDYDYDCKYKCKCR